MQMAHDPPGCNVAWTERHGRLEILAVAGGILNTTVAIGVMRVKEAALTFLRVLYQDRLDTQDRIMSYSFNEFFFACLTPYLW